MALALAMEAGKQQWQQRCRAQSWKDRLSLCPSLPLPLPWMLPCLACLVFFLALPSCHGPAVEEQCSQRCLYWLHKAFAATARLARPCLPARQLLLTCLMFLGSPARSTSAAVLQSSRFVLLTQLQTVSCAFCFTNIWLFDMHDQTIQPGVTA